MVRLIGQVWQLTWTLVEQILQSDKPNHISKVKEVDGEIDTYQNKKEVKKVKNIHISEIN